MNPPTSPPRRTGGLQAAPVQKVICHGPSLELDGLREVVEREGVALRAIPSLEERHFREGELQVLLLEDDLLAQARDGLEERLRKLGERCGIIYLGAGLELPAAIPEEAILAFLRKPLEAAQFLSALRSAFRHSLLRKQLRESEARLGELDRHIRELTQIGIALSAEHDHRRLLDLILTKTREFTRSDAGSLYFVEGTGEGGKQLRFIHAQNESVYVPFREFTLPVNTRSIAGYVAATGETLNLDDVYELPPGVDFSFNRSFDERVGYRTKSMLAVPIRDHEGQIIGVLQLINAKRDAAARITPPEAAEAHVIPFARALEDLVRSLASQAAVCMENSRLLQEIERLFEAFVMASVTAIEQRDPTTLGHSLRVTELTCALAEVVKHAGEGLYGKVRFSPEQMRELRYAGLLHDFGKVGVREKVLVKADKLYPLELEVVRARFRFIKRTIQQEYTQRRLDHLLAHPGEDCREALAALDRELAEKLEELDRELALVERIDLPAMLPEGSFEELEVLGRKKYRDFDGQEHPYLTEAELIDLSIRQGSLDDAEREEIESHVSHSYDFLTKIPWTRDLRGIPDIAHGHHEKLNGEGYPRGLKGDEIILQSRMMCVADIFDALTASDRPYKKAVPLEEALQVLRSGAKDNHLDSELVRLFVENKVYRNLPAFRDAG
ncbi:MAG: HD domain-containing phosphohydrolase [Nitrospinota bacterium]